MWVICTWAAIIAFGAAIALVVDIELERERKEK